MLQDRSSQVAGSITEVVELVDTQLEALAAGLDKLSGDDGSSGNGKGKKKKGSHGKGGKRH
jgi:hypothetical protein